MGNNLALLCKEGKGLRQIKSKGWHVKSEELDSLTPVDNGIWETGNWRLSPKRASSLVGELVVISASTKTPAYIGGTIQKVVPESKSDSANRYKITFKESRSLKGFTDHLSTWKGSNPVHYF